MTTKSKYRAALRMLCAAEVFIELNAAHDAAPFSSSLDAALAALTAAGAVERPYSILRPLPEDATILEEVRKDV